MFLRRAVLLLTVFILLFPVTIKAEGQQEQNEPTLTIWNFKYNDPGTRRVLKKIDNMFLDDNPGTKLEHIGFDDEEYIPALRASLLAGTGPDIIWLHQGTEFIEYQSYLEELDVLLFESELEFRPDSISPCLNEEGKLKALPVTFQGMGWYYNKELFRKAGLDPEKAPVEWEDFLKTCSVLRENNITPISTGNNRPLTTDFIRRSLITSFFTDSGIKDFYKQGRGIVSAEYRVIMDFCLTLRKEEYLNTDGIYQPYFNYAPDTFSSGESAMIIGLLSDIAHWKEFSDKLGKDNVGYFPNLIHPLMKRPGTQLLQNAGVIIGVNKSSKNKELAFDYLQNLFSQKSQKILIDDLGLLMPVGNPNLPLEEYPVLAEIEKSLEKTGADIELFTPSTYIRDMTYLYDRLLINTMEISLDDYIKRLYDKLKFF